MLTLMIQTDAHKAADVNRSVRRRWRPRRRSKVSPLLNRAAVVSADAAVSAPASWAPGERLSACLSQEGGRKQDGASRGLFTANAS